MTANIERPSTGFNFQKAIATFWKKNSKEVIPPVIAIFIFLAVWQLLAVVGLTKLPGPLEIFTNERTRVYLMYPWFDRGGIDKGLFWQTF
ncbi:hypothetical protein [Phormidium pseudopriestleyi]|uniref:hypothetical protein n=1 Tax=Phormidium pseudopriestleyi TaxID=1759527 RepID=UPI0030F42488